MFHKRNKAPANSKLVITPVFNTLFKIIGDCGLAILTICLIYYSRLCAIFLGAQLGVICEDLAENENWLVGVK